MCPVSMPLASKIYVSWVVSTLVQLFCPWNPVVCSLNYADISLMLKFNHTTFYLKRLCASLLFWEWRWLPRLDRLWCIVPTPHLLLDSPDSAYPVPHFPVLALLAHSSVQEWRDACHLLLQGVFVLIRKLRAAFCSVSNTYRASPFTSCASVSSILKCRKW